MKKSTWVVTVIVIIAIIGIGWYVMQTPIPSSNAPAAPVTQTPAAQNPTNGTGVQVPAGKYPIHITPTGGVSVYYAPDNSPTGATAKSILVSNPPEHTIVSSPLQISGTAKGWYFEGSFPAILTDAKGNILARTAVKAQSDWMTDQFVPFAGSFGFKAQPTGSKGVLILMKDNPSGLPANDASIEIQVTF